MKFYNVKPIAVRTSKVIAIETFDKPNTENGDEIIIPQNKYVLLISVETRQHPIVCEFADEDERNQHLEALKEACA